MKKKTLTETMVSRFDGIDDIEKNPISMSYNDIAQEIINPQQEIKDSIQKIRANHPNKKAIKDNLFSFMISGEVQGGKGYNRFKTYNGVIGLDIDDQDETTLNELIDKLKHDGNIYMYFISPSGEGLKVFYRMEDRLKNRMQEIINQKKFFYAADSHKIMYNALKIWFTNRYNINLDNSVSNMSRQCFMSHDPNLYYNPDAELLNLDKEIEEVKESKDFVYHKAYTQSNTAYSSDFQLRRFTLDEIYAYVEEECCKNLYGSRNNFLYHFAIRALKYRYEIPEIQDYILPKSELSWDEIKVTIIKANKNSYVANDKIPLYAS